jgi:hypothetical protein
MKGNAMKKIHVLRAAIAFAGAAALSSAAHALPAVQRTADAIALPAVQSGWFAALLAQLQALLGA